MLRIAAAAVDHPAGDAHAGRARVAPQRRVVRDVRAAGHVPVPRRLGGALPAGPLVVLPRAHEIDFLERAPADVAEDGRPARRVQAEPERAAQAARVDLAPHRIRVCLLVVGIARHAGPVRGDPQQLPVRLVEILGAQRERVGEVRAAAVAHADPERARRIDLDVRHAVDVGVARDLEQRPFVAQGGRRGIAGEGPPADPPGERAAGRHRAAGVDVPGGGEVRRHGDAEQAGVAAGEGRELGDHPGRRPSRLQPGDGAVLAGGQHARVRQVGEVGEVEGSLSGGQVGENEPGGQGGRGHRCRAGHAQHRRGEESGRQCGDDFSYRHGDRQAMSATIVTDMSAWSIVTLRIFGSGRSNEAKRNVQNSFRFAA